MMTSTPGLFDMLGGMGLGGWCGSTQAGKPQQNLAMAQMGMKMLQPPPAPAIPQMSQGVQQPPSAPPPATQASPAAGYPGGQAGGGLTSGYPGGQAGGGNLAAAYPQMQRPQRPMPYTPPPYPFGR